ncbi:protein-glutamine gamma-glutamyltransferase [Paenibacillus donghaensis]|uniref:Protein-glutamine gamma-glutamyltransferase n=1 Tax=Paenibacillus donghaensis TaxID=414771 RepID=A0A2Z2KNM0_9BACL|nr:protein-glutamine gamma-glutamyltransferase [Paenibacillus donghaensis]ASA25203.1 protein-glutamine gamma-glutamyltransferase [Paenibacillus donghaensis]
MVGAVRNPAAQAFERNMREQIISSARDLNASGADFAVFNESRCNPLFWLRTDNGGFQLRRGVQPSEAIMDIYTNGRMYAFECATAMVIVLYRATLLSIGEAAFNRHFNDLFLWDWNYDSNLRLITTYTKQEILPGDIVYFKNPDHDPGKPEWQGENAVKLGPDLYYGHGIGITSAEQIIASLNEERFPGSRVSAYYTDEALHPDFEYLRMLSTRLDTVPGSSGSRSRIFSRIGARTSIYR